MEDIKLEFVSDYYDNNDDHYNCPECSSLIEIKSINEKDNILEYKCLNCNKNQTKKINIKTFLEKMKKKAGNKINHDSCQIHNNNKFISYCFDCNCHLCIECLKLREHLYHNKNNIIEIQPIQEELNIIEDIISYYKNKIDSLEEEKSNKIKNVNDSFIKDKNKNEKDHKEKVKKNSKDKNEELKKVKMSICLILKKLN